MPRLGTGMNEGTVLQWLESEGDAVNEGESIAEIETTKAGLRRESRGLVRRIRRDVGRATDVVHLRHQANEAAVVHRIRRHLERHAPLAHVVDEDVQRLVRRDVIAVVHVDLHLVEVLVEPRTPVDEEAHFPGGNLLVDDIARCDAPAVGDLRIRTESRRDVEPGRLALRHRPAGLAVVEHHLVLHHHGATPQRCADLQRLAAGPVGPAIEAATDPALVVPRDDLPFLHLPVTEQA
ncbi:MAG: hypothetical protein IPO20_14355 [Gammaproteobacteria bacterium]|nr:hypothetical protein [Gammaproteobacteria bacterium]